jgi:hypothetical protein
LESISPTLSRGALRRWLLAASSVLSFHSALAQNEPAPPIPWAYSAYFGTGVYQIANGEKAYVFRVSPSWQWREASVDEQGRRAIGWKFRFPVALGVHDLDANDIGSTLSPDNVSALTAVPGVEADIPIGPRWSLRPFANVGWGAEMGSGSSSAWIYWTGVKSRLAFPGGDGFEWSLVNSLTYSGYTNDAHQSNRVLPLFTGFEFDRPIEKKLGGDPVHIYWHFGYTDYLNHKPLLVGSSVGSIDIEDEWEGGVAFGKGAEPLRLWRLHWNRVGVAYRFSSDGSFKGISVFFSSLFDR